MKYVIWWLIVAIPSFLISYCHWADMNDKLLGEKYENGFWRFYKSFFRQGFKAFVHEYFGLYCPWSQKIAKSCRLANPGVYHSRARHWGMVPIYFILAPIAGVLIIASTILESLLLIGSRWVDKKV